MPHLERVETALPPVTGRPGLTQGRYGDRGNLELVAPAVDGGMWVLWFNADETEHRSGAAVGEWSGALHFGDAGTVRQAVVTQVAHGPDFLEVIALGDGRAARWFWTPADGFVDGGQLPGEVCAVSAVAATPSALHVVAAHAHRELGHAVATLDRYPHVRWRTRMLGRRGDELSLAADGDQLQLAVRDGAALAVLRRHGGEWRTDAPPPGEWGSLAPTSGTVDVVVGTDLAGRVQLAVREGERWSDTALPWPGLAVDAVAAAWTTLHGGRLDVVVRVGDELRHGWHPTRDTGHWAAPRPVRSRVWLMPGTPVHRRS